jgi:hypothetical protein
MKLTDFNLDGVVFGAIDKKQQKEWDELLDRLIENIEKSWPGYCEQMRRIKSSSYRLSLTRIL